MTSFGWARLALVTVLGMGVWGGNPTAALAGDKLHFSAASDTLDLPEAEKGDTRTEEINFFKTGNPNLQMPVLYPWSAPVTTQPARRKDNSIFGNKDGDLDHWAGDSIWSPEGGTNSDRQPATNQWNNMKAWNSLDQQDPLRRELDQVNGRSRPMDRIPDSMTGLGSRNQLDTPNSGQSGGKDWAGRKANPYGADRPTTLGELLRPRSLLSPPARLGSVAGLGENTGLMPRSLGSKSSLSSSRFDRPSLMPASAYNSAFNNTSPNNAEAGLSRPSASPLHEPAAGFARSQFDQTGPLGALPGMDNLYGRGDRPAPPPPKIKSLTPGAPLPGQQPRTGTDLPWPKRPGAVIN